MAREYDAIKMELYLDNFQRSDLNSLTNLPEKTFKTNHKTFFTQIWAQLNLNLADHLKSALLRKQVPAA